MLIISEIFYSDRIYIRLMDDNNRDELFVEVDQPDLKNKIFNPLYNLKKNSHKFFHKRFAILGDFRIGKTELGNYITYKLKQYYTSKDCIIICINSYKAKDKGIEEIDNWLYSQWLNLLMQVDVSEFKECVFKVLNEFEEERGYNYIDIKPINFIDKLNLICKIYKAYRKVNKQSRFVVEFEQANVIYEDEIHFIPFYQFWRNFQGYWEDENYFADLRIFIFVIGHQNWKKFASLFKPSGRGVFDVIGNYDYWTNENIYQMFKKRLKYAIKTEFEEEYLKYFLCPGIVEFFGNRLGKINTVEYLDAFFGEDGYLEKFNKNFYKNIKDYTDFFDFCSRTHRKEEYDNTYFKDIEKLFIDIPGADYMHTFLYLSDNQSETWYEEFFKLIREIFINGALTYGSKIFNELKNLDKDFIKENFTLDPFKNIRPTYLPALFLEDKGDITLDPSFRDKLSAIPRSVGRGDQITRLKSYIESQRIRSNKFLKSRDGKEIKTLILESLDISETIFAKVQKWSVNNYYGIVSEDISYTNDDLLPFHHIRAGIFRLKQFYKGNSTIWAQFDDYARELGKFMIEELFPKDSPALSYIDLNEFKEEIMSEKISNIEIMRKLNTIFINLIGKIEIFNSVIVEKNKRRTTKILEGQKYDAYEEQVLNELLNRIGKFKGKIIQKSDYQDFLNQFDVDLRNSMLKILKRITYYAQEEIIDNLTKLIESLPYSSDSRLYIGVFDNLIHHSNVFYSYVIDKKFNINGKKVYNYKTTQLVNKLKRIPEEQEITIIFIDDVIGTGRQFVRSYNQYFKKDFEAANLHQNENIKLFLVACVGSSESLKYISDKTALNENTIRYHKIIRDQDKAFYKEHWKDPEELKNLKEFLKLQDPKYWDGWKKNPDDPNLKGLEFLVIMEWNIPNATISCLWKETNDWKALFPRS